MRTTASNDRPSFVVAPADLAIYALGRHGGEMVIQMELGFEGRLDETILSLAADLLLDVEPILGCRLALDASNPRWQRVLRANRRRLVVAHSLEEYEAFRSTGLDATANVQVALCLWQSESGDQLIIKMTHEAGDGVGLQLLTDRLSFLYSELSANAAYRPQSHSRVRRDFDQVLSSVPPQAYSRILWDFMKFVLPRRFPLRTHALPLPAESVGPWKTVIKRLPSTQLAFLSAYGKARGSTLNDVFLAAAYRALAAYGAWDGTTGLRISITVDLRRWCVEPAARSICNLSSFEYPFLNRNLGRHFDETLANVTALTRRRKESWPGLAVAMIGHLVMKRYSTHGFRRRLSTGIKDSRPWRANARRRLTLSNEGRLDKSRLQFGGQAPAFAHIVPPFVLMPHVHICMTGYDGALTLVAVTPQNGYAVVDAYLDTLLEQLPIRAVATAVRSADGRTLDRRSA